MTIRGQTTNVAEINSDQAVGIVINGAPVTRGTNLFSNLFDVEQILSTDAVAELVDPGQEVIPSIGLVNGQIDFDVDESWNIAFYGKIFSTMSIFLQDFQLQLIKRLLIRH